MKKNRVRELYQQYVGGMEEWQIKLAIARMMHFRVPQEAWQDTMQELAIVVHQFTFDPEKAHAASEKTILCRLMDNRIRMLARSNARRLAMLERLGQMTQNEEDTHAPDGIAFDSEVRQLVDSLTPLQQQVCEQLMNGLGEFQIAKALGRHYTTICRNVHHIRKAFADRGFNPWPA
ncbi:MAG TPA: ECF-type sigma factor [Phycisphaerae bacterium]|nr:ECF-type sigma factor [Phycisphaerae bacterium]